MCPLESGFYYMIACCCLLSETFLPRSLLWCWDLSMHRDNRIRIRNLRNKCRPLRWCFYHKNKRALYSIVRKVEIVLENNWFGPRSSTVSFTFNPTNKIVASVISIGSDYLAARGSRLILPCTALGDTPLQISWFQDGRQLSDWLNLNPSKLGGQIQQPWIQQPNKQQQEMDETSAGLIHGWNFYEKFFQKMASLSCWLFYMSKKLDLIII